MMKTAMTLLPSQPNRPPRIAIVSALPVKIPEGTRENQDAVKPEGLRTAQPRNLTTLQ